MMHITRWLIESTDRVGMVTDVVTEFSQQDINITKMEVTVGQIFIKFILDDDYIKKNLLYDKLLNFKDVKNIKDIDFSPPNQNEAEFKAIIESIGDGIIGLTKKGFVRYFNRTALDYFDLNYNEIANLHISQLIHSESTSIFEKLLKGYEFNGQLVTSKKGVYVCSGKAILSNQQKVTSVFFIFKKSISEKNFNKLDKNIKADAFSTIIHNSTAIEKVIKMATKIANSRYTVLIKGETGTGKELFARAIHDTSNRREYPFFPINCAALSENLLESELFGYESGSFTGAIKEGKKGLFVLANNGTLFLDEFSELSLNLQSKLLRVLQDNIIRRIGGTKYISVNVRIIVATNRDLKKMIEQKSFRQDLFYRINIIPIEIPPLRDRKEDILLICNYFLRKYCAEFNKNLFLSSEVESYLINHTWPGNVRELQNIILRAVHLATNDYIELDDLLIQMDEMPIDTDTSNVKNILEKTEKEMIKKLLKQLGTARAVARAIGLSHTTVLKKIRKYGI